MVTRRQQDSLLKLYHYYYPSLLRQPGIRRCVDRARGRDGDGVYVIDVDTAGLCKLTSTAASPTWLPSGNKIAFYDKDAINVINADGSERKELIDAVPDQPAQAWSPEGERIAFEKQSDLYAINADGSSLRRLANAKEAVGSPTWSPDGEKIAFPCPAAPEAVGTDLCVMNADGTERKRIALKVAPEEVPVAVSWGRG